MNRFGEIVYQAVGINQKIFSKMSFNPPLSQDVHTKNLLPLLANGEAYILLRPKTQVSLQLSKRKVVGKGSTVLTTHRIVFIKDQNEDFKKVFSSLSVPYSHLEHPLFVQPLLRTNHFKFTVHSDRNGAHPFESEGLFKLLFVSGGAQVFLNMFYKFYARYRNNPALMSSSNPMSDLRDDNCAFVDPSDPSHLYFTQPETTQIHTTNNSTNNTTSNTTESRDDTSGQPTESQNQSTDSQENVNGETEGTVGDSGTGHLMNQIGKCSALFRLGR